MEVEKRKSVAERASDIAASLDARAKQLDEQKKASHTQRLTQQSEWDRLTAEWDNVSRQVISVVDEYQTALRNKKITLTSKIESVDQSYVGAISVRIRINTIEIHSALHVDMSRSGALRVTRQHPGQDDAVDHPDMSQATRDYWETTIGDFIERQVSR